jgi:hypothetical protein
MRSVLAPSIADRCPPLAAQSAAATNKLAPVDEPKSPGHPGLPDGLSGLVSVADFTAALESNVPILITDGSRSPVLHMRPRECRGVNEQSFRRKVVDGKGKNGQYIRVDNTVAASTMWPMRASCRWCARGR